MALLSEHSRCAICGERLGEELYLATSGVFFPADDSFTDACTWPDHPRKRAEEHFINVPRTLQTIATAQCQGAPTCLFTPIVTDREVLRTSNDDQAKLASLKFLGHWVGDIHQPLHVSFADDPGATSSARAVRA